MIFPSLILSECISIIGIHASSTPITALRRTPTVTVCKTVWRSIFPVICDSRKKQMLH